MFEAFDIWYDDRLGREEGRPFVIERDWKGRMRRMSSGR
jgi:hypothetical protein